MPSGSGITLRNSAEADIPTPGTGQVTIFNDSDRSNAPAYKDDAGTVLAFVGAPGADAPALTYDDHSNTGATETIDWSAADVQRLVANAATVTLSYSGIPAAGNPGAVQAWLEQDVVGGRIWVFPAATTWGAAGEPDWSTRGPNDIDLVKLECVDGGTTVVATLDGRRGDTGATGAAGTNGVDGTVGGAIAIDYAFSTTTTDSDPGNGTLRLSNATQASAVTIRADLLDTHGVDWAAVLDTLADASNTVKGHIRLFKKADPTKWLIYTVAAVATPSGYRNITVANVGSSGANPLTNGDAITLAFSRSGDQGSTVGAGTVTTVEEVDGSPTDSAVTKIVFPNGTLGIAAHVATYTPPVTGIAEFPTAAASVATDESSNATAYGNLTTSGPAVTVTIGASGKAFVTVAAFTYPAGTSHGHYMGFAVSGATTIAAADATAYQNDGGSGNGGNHASLRSLVTGLTPGSTTFTAKYRVDNSGDTAHWSMRTIIVEPVL